MLNYANLLEKLSFWRLTIKCGTERNKMIKVLIAEQKLLNCGTKTA